jgi:hypothetical protein
MISVRCARRLASRSAASDESGIPAVAAVKTTPVLIALKPRTTCRKTVTTNEMPSSSSHWMFCVISARFEVRSRNRLVESSDSRPARS